MLTAAASPAHAHVSSVCCPRGKDTTPLQDSVFLLFILKTFFQQILSTETGWRQLEAELLYLHQHQFGGKAVQKKLNKARSLLQHLHVKFRLRETSKTRSSSYFRGEKCELRTLKNALTIPYVPSLKKARSGVASRLRVHVCPAKRHVNATLPRARAHAAAQSGAVVRGSPLFRSPPRSEVPLCTEMFRGPNPALSGFHSSTLQVRNRLRSCGVAGSLPPS